MIASDVLSRGVMCVTQVQGHVRNALGSIEYLEVAVYVQKRSTMFSNMDYLQHMIVAHACLNAKFVIIPPHALNATEQTVNRIVLVLLKDFSTFLLQEILLNTTAALVSRIDV